MLDYCRAEVIGVGSEILLGQINNSHAQTVSQTFARYGFFVYHHSAVGDNQTRIEQLLSLAALRSNVVIVTGGLGPTADDLTKESLAAFLNRPLDMSEEALRTLEDFFGGRHRKMPEENTKQALCIRGGELLPNPNGTAPGQYVCDGDVHYFLLPGPPLEMSPMLVNEVIPRLQVIFANRGALISRILHFCGIGESTVDEQVADLTTVSNPTVAPLAGEGEMLLRITSSAPTEAEASAQIKPIEEELRRRFNPYIYGVDSDTLPSVVADVFVARGLTLSVAESCTGGLLSSMVTALPGASQFFYGGIVSYDNRVKEKLLLVDPLILQNDGAVSEKTAMRMAEGVRSQCGTSYGVSLTGIAGPTGGSPNKPVGLVYIGIAGPDGASVFRAQFRGSRDQIRIRAAKQALWRLWSTVLGRLD